MEGWITVLDSAQRLRLRQPQESHGRIAGWATKVRNGFSHRRYLSLVGCAIFYSRRELKAPNGHINLAGAKLRILDPDDDSDADEDLEPGLTTGKPSSAGQKLMQTGSLLRRGAQKLAASLNGMPGDSGPGSALPGSPPSNRAGPGSGLGASQSTPVSSSAVIQHRQQQQQQQPLASALSPSHPYGSDGNAERTTGSNAASPSLGLSKTPTAASSASTLPPSSTAVVYVLQVRNDDHQCDLVFERRNDRDRWAHFCAGITGQSLLGAGTGFEQCVRQLVTELKAARSATAGSSGQHTRSRRVASVTPSADRFQQPQLWPTPGPRSEPLTTLPDAQHDLLAIEMHKQVHLFVNVPQAAINQEGLAYHITLAQQIMRLVLAHPELRDELVAQLIVETNRPLDDEEMTDNAILPYLSRQAWQLLALTCPMFLPSKTMCRWV